MKKIAIFLTIFFVSATLCSIGSEPLSFSQELKSKQPTAEQRRLDQQRLFKPSKYIITSNNASH
jgi:hypothetical protein